MFNFPSPTMPPVASPPQPGAPQPGQPPQGLQLPNSPTQLPFMPNQPLNAQMPMQMNDMSKMLQSIGTLAPQPGSAQPPSMSPNGVNPLDFIGKMMPQNGTPGPMQRPPMMPNRNGFQGAIPQGPNLGSLGNALLQQGGLPQGNQQTMARRGKGKDYTAQ